MMPRSAEADLRLRVLILAPVGRDAALTQSLLRGAELGSRVCSSLGDLQLNLAQGAGAALVVEEALIGQDVGELVEWITRQPSWSDFPFIILLGPGASAECGGHELDVLQRAGNLTLLERPVGTATLLSAVRAALRAPISGP